MALFSRRPAPAGNAPPPRLLFLDDDPARAEVFLAEHPDAVWVQTTVDCLARLEEVWDAVHLDHDLGGEHFVDGGRDDCGMEVVRWLCMHPRPHLAKTRFFIHSHNARAATMMGVQMMMNGYAVEVRPFGTGESLPLPFANESPLPRVSPLAALARQIRRLLGREAPEDYGYTTAPRPDEPPLEKFDFDWVPPSLASHRDGGEKGPEPPSATEPPQRP